MNAKILIVDDEPDVIESYRDLLEETGLELTGVTSRADALEHLERAGPWDVILLDEMLHGGGGSPGASEFLLQIAALAPATRTIVITGFATPELVRSALQAGAWEYLEKDFRFLKLLLPLRVRHAVEAARSRQIAHMAPADIEGELRRAWNAARDPTEDAHRRGRLLEETICLLWRTMPGFSEARVNVRGSAEEFDVVVQNASSDPILRKERQFILAECKNWSSKVGPPEYVYFRDKVRARRQRVSLGLLISMQGFTAGVDTHHARTSEEEALVLLLDGEDLNAWIADSDRVSWLRERIEAATLRAG